ncbi:MAG: hypothetical protein RLZ98_3810 [Pseudomonadota bacterium]|jgi:Flp pilus assembly protein TadG
MHSSLKRNLARKAAAIRNTRALLDDFSHDERGVTAVIFAICFVAVFFISAMAIDYGFGSHEKMRQQAALDAATLAAADKLGLPNGELEGKAIAEAFFKANSNSDVPAELSSFKLDAEKGEIVAHGASTYFTTLLAGVNITRLSIGTASRIVRGLNSAEIALVLDNSGSMGGQPLADLKSAAGDLLDIVFAGAEGSERMRIGIVPFAGSVNVGSINATAPWMDQNAASPLHRENLEAGTTKTRFQLLDDMGVAWAGCVEARPAPYDVNDTPATDGVGETYFVPLFAPDEPDSNNDAGNTYYNSYLTDDGGACTPQPQTCTGGYSRRGNCRGWTKDPLDPVTAQSRVCKYAGASVSGSGPNYACTTSPILPLTSTKIDIQSAIAAMGASGNTNIGEGVMWGVRVLSPGEPFSEGRAYDADRNQKFLVLMTDGQNTYSALSNHNRSTFGAYGFAKEGRLGTTYQNTAFRNQMNSKTQSACSAAKAAGIIVYTIAFRLENDPVTTTLLNGCATSGDRALKASNGDGLIEAFRQIGREISALRVAG